MLMMMPGGFVDCRQQFLRPGSSALQSPHFWFVILNPFLSMNAEFDFSSTGSCYGVSMYLLLLNFPMWYSKGFQESS